MLKKLSYLMISLILFVIGSGNKLPQAVEAERLEIKRYNNKGELIR